MRRPRLLSLACLLLFTGAGFADFNQSDAELARDAATAFREGVRLSSDREQAMPHFREAVRCYEELRQRGVNNVPLYLNLGKAALQCNDIAGALAAYHHGLRLAPTDARLTAAIELARQRVNYPLEGAVGKPPTLELSFLPSLDSTRLSWLAGGFYLFACLTLTRAVMVRQRAILITGLALFLAAVTTTFLGIIVLIGEQHRSAERWAIVAVEGVQLRRGGGWLRPGEPAFPPRHPSPLPRGVEAHVLTEKGDWLQIELQSGEVGWVPRTMMLVV